MNRYCKISLFLTALRIALRVVLQDQTCCDHKWFVVPSQFPVVGTFESGSEGKTVGEVYMYVTLICINSYVDTDSLTVDQFKHHER